MCWRQPANAERQAEYDVMKALTLSIIIPGDAAILYTGLDWLVDSFGSAAGVICLASGITGFF